MNKMLFLYNPKSGAGKIRNSLADLIEMFSENDYQVTVYPTKAPLDAIQYIEKNGTQVDEIVVCGGDGILHEALNGLGKIDFQVPLGCIPCGTVNDFANSHEIPFDLIAAGKMICEQQPLSVDVAKFNDEYFSYIAACGISTQVPYTTSQTDKKMFGPLAYIVKGLNVVDFTHWENNCVTMNVSWEKGSAEGDFLFASFSNTLYIGSVDSLVMDGARFNDGLLEGLLIRRPMNLLELHQIAQGILKKDFSSDFFVQVRSPWFEIESEPTDWTLDGEFGGNLEYVKIQTYPNKLKLIRPPLQKESEKNPTFTQNDEMKSL